ncbi:hypothetical protein GA0115249_114417 [Streptomyces sp. PpalLS-921]|nr:hypothetical protein YUMDRAFT_00539 [Streptomyces sp. OspMP-M45]SCE16001.1 hypothetical protein GA0115249_114417 [Streptomyces sp. PpalLS-921]
MRRRRAPEWVYFSVLAALSVLLAFGIGVTR